MRELYLAFRAFDPRPSEIRAHLMDRDAIDTFVLVCGKGVAWLILPMVMSLVWEVTARYGFNAPTEWAYDMTFMLYGTFFMVGSAWTLQRGGHIRTDSFYSKWSKRTQARPPTRSSTRSGSTRSISTTGSLACASGATPPIEKPVRALTKSASALAESCVPAS